MIVKPVHEEHRGEPQGRVARRAQSGACEVNVKGCVGAEGQYAFKRWV